MYATDVGVEIRARAQAFQDKWKGREPGAVEAFMNGFELTLRYVSVDFPRAHVSLLRTTNLLERFHKEIRRKQKDIGMFQSETGCEVCWYVMATRETAKQSASCQGPG
jgi:transposase-like protein